MMNDAGVYDLGDLDRTPSGRAAARADAQTSAQPGPRPARDALRSHTEALRLSRVRRARTAGGVFGTLSVVVPGAGQALSGDVRAGLFFFSGAGFLVAVSWAIHDMLLRLSQAIGVLGGPPEASVWLLGGVWTLLALLHLGSVAHAHQLAEDAGHRAPSHPVAAALASLAVPGWGQALNGDRLRSLLFLGGLWVVASGWLLASRPSVELLDSLGLYLPAALASLTTGAVRWTLPAVLWSMAVYDAAASAALRRARRAGTGA